MRYFLQQKKEKVKEASETFCWIEGFQIRII